MLIEDERGNQLVEVRLIRELDLTHLAPLTHAVVIARRPDGRVLFVFDRRKQHWELPGGAIEPGEGPRAGAVRELREESGVLVVPDALAFAGAIVLHVGPNRHDSSPHVEYGALYAVEASDSQAFVPNDEISDVCWWDGRDDIGVVSVLDRALAVHAATPGLAG